jgi:transposase-like protein
MASKRMDLPTLIDQFSDEAKCRAYLEALRWPDGITCPQCGAGDDRVTPIPSRGLWRCNECQYQLSVRAGTILQDSKLPLWKWFLATYLICEAKKGISANQLKRMIGVGSYRTAWYVSHRVRAAMGIVWEDQLRGIVEADETFVGGKTRRGTGRRDEWGGIPGPDPARPKAVVLGAVERETGNIRLSLAPNRGRASLKAFLDEAVADEAIAVYTDDWRPYRTIVADGDTRHETVNHSANEWVRGDVHTNGIESVWSLLKRSIVGSYHHVSVKHLPAYLEEIEFKYNNRFNPHIFRETLRVLVTADPLTYDSLISKPR